VLFTPEVHEPLTGRGWDEEWVRERIETIADDTEASVGADGLWPEHPLDYEEDKPGRLGLYLGAAGIAWGLAQLGRPRPDLVHDLHRRYLDTPDWPGVVPGYLCGEAGILLVSYRLAPSDETAGLLARTIEANLGDETLELLWGLPGTMLAALAMDDLTGESRWADLWRACADRLWAAWTPRADGTHLWTQRLYGRDEVYVGAAHGFAGAALTLSLGRHLLGRARAAELDRRVVATAAALATPEDGLANWAPEPGGPLTHRDGIRVQWCHGSPGMVTSLATVAVDDSAFTSLLAAGGELTWRAGPLVKGAGLCHGTAGNGLAFLALHRRTGDPRWLERGRRFAVHALEQVDRERARHGVGRHSLWTGDIGVAVMARSCIDGRPGVPTLDWV
jgi:hypothetical protein